MTVDLTPEEAAIASGRDGHGAAMAMRIVAESARLLGARRLIPIASAHIDDSTMGIPARSLPNGWLLAARVFPYGPHSMSERSI